MSFFKITILFTYHSKLIVNFKIVFLYHIAYNKVENRRYQYAHFKYYS